MASKSSMLLIGLAGKPKSGGDKPMGKGMGPMLIGDKSEEEAPEDDTKEGRVAAMKAFISAVKSGDAEAADDALQTHYDLCSEAHRMSEEDEGDEY